MGFSFDTEKTLRDGGHVFRLSGRCLLSYEGPGGEVRVPEGIVCINMEAFAFCGEVTDVILPEGIERISDRAFFRCGLRSISLPGTLTFIDQYAFADSLLEQIDIPDSVLSMEEGAFRGAARLKAVRLPKGLTALNPDCFAECTSLREIVLPESLKYIHGGVFRGCTALEKINFPKNLVCVWTRAFCDCSSLREVRLGSSVEGLGNEAFKNCTGLKKVHIPEALKEKFEYAFAGTEFVPRKKGACPEPPKQDSAETPPASWQGFTEKAADDPAIGSGTDGRPALRPTVWHYFDRLSREERIREMTHTFRITGDIDGAGWAKIRIMLDGTLVWFRISYIGMSPAGFRETVRELADGDNRRFGWTAEPGSFPWFIQRRGRVLYVKAPEIGRPFFIPFRVFLDAVSGMTDDW